MSQKRELLLSTALDLFYRHGIHSVGINEVIKVSGVAKKTLYSHFDGKDVLIMAALAQRHQVFMGLLEDKVKKTTNRDELIDVFFRSLERWF